MKTSRAQLFTQHTQAQRVLAEVIAYISASFTNPELWQIIQSVAKEETDKLVKRIQAEKAQAGPDAQANPNWFSPLELAEPGTFFSIHFFLLLSHKLSQLHGSDDNGGLLHVVGEAFQLLLDKGILDIPYGILDRDAWRGSRPQPKNQHYKLQKNFAEYCIKNSLIYNHLFGFNYIIDRYTASVVKIEVTQGADVALGTGWFFDLPSTSPGCQPIRMVVTNDHVIAGSSSIKMLNKSDQIIPHYKSKSLLNETGVDIALIQVAYSKDTPAFLLQPSVELLEEIITVGYPSVPLAREAYQLVHRGEVNARVTDYYGQELLVISARSAPGNSGSPVIDDTGRVVGMVTQQLFEKSAFEQKGITPYSACIPAAVIQKAINQYAYSWINSAS